MEPSFDRCCQHSRSRLQKLVCILLFIVFFFPYVEIKTKRQITCFTLNMLNLNDFKEMFSLNKYCNLLYHAYQKCRTLLGKEECYLYNYFLMEYWI